MAAFVVGVTALVAVVLSFLLAGLVVVSVHRSQASAPPDRAEDPGDPAATIARVLGEIERLAELRERGVLTDKEFATQKTRLLRATNDRSPTQPN